MTETTGGIRPLAGDDEAAECARMMVASEPWITLRRTFDEAFRALRDPTREVYVRVDDGRIRGFIILALDGPFAGYVQTVFVAPEARGRGLGSELVAFAEARIAPVAPTVFLCVSSFNHEARALYERLGYEAVGELPGYLEDGYSEILMWKRRMSWNAFRERAP